MKHEENMKNSSANNIKWTIVWIMLIINLFSVVFLSFKFKKLDLQSAHYVMYVGTNDKDTNTQLISKEDAIKIIDEACLKYTDGYTLQDAYGRWKNEKNNLSSEYTVMCIFDDISKEKIHSIADEVVKNLNQNCVLIERSSIQTEYYPES